MPGAAVGRNHAAGRGDRMGRRILAKHQKYGVPGNGERAETIVGGEARQTEEALIEFGGAGYVLDMNRGFYDAVDLHRAVNRPSVSSNDFGKRAASSVLCVTTMRIAFETRLISSRRSATVAAV